MGGIHDGPNGTCICLSVWEQLLHMIYGMRHVGGSKGRLSAARVNEGYRGGYWKLTLKNSTLLIKMTYIMVIITGIVMGTCL